MTCAYAPSGNFVACGKSVQECCCSGFTIICRAANYCRTSDNVRLNLANVRAKVILIGHWSDQNIVTLYIFLAVTEFTWHSSILLNVAPELLYILVL